MFRLNSFRQTILAIVALEIIAGCTSLKMPKPNMWPFSSEDAPGTPTRVVSSWNDTILYQPNQVPLRGFGGRLLFYAGDKPEPVKVDGTLTVYVFDETNRDPNNVRPDRKYVFTKEQLPSHYSKSKLGHSYSVWIPWDEAGGPQKELSMIARFTPDKGSVVVGEQTKQILPGTTQIVAKNSGSGVQPSTALPAMLAQNPNTQNGSVQSASYVMPLPPVDSQMQGAAQNGADPSHLINTTTIKLPPQSTLKSSMLMGDMPNQAMNNPRLAPSGVQSNTVIGTGVINTAVPGMEKNSPIHNPGIPAINAGMNFSNQSSRNFSQPTRFAPGRLPAPNALVTQQSRDREPWQPPPSGQGYFPETTPQPVTGN
jgi:hypothetical protein